MFGFKPFFIKKDTKKNELPKKQNIDDTLFDLRTNMSLLKDKYDVILEKELMIARANKRNGKKDSGNYSRIGIAYYSLNIINTASEKLHALTSNREIYNCMEQLGATLGVINGVAGKVPGLNPKGLIYEIEKMARGSGGASNNLLQTLAALGNANTGLADAVPIDSLVSLNVIEKLIDGADPLQCVATSEGLCVDTTEVMSTISKAAMGAEKTAEVTTSGDTYPSTEDIKDLMSRLTNSK